MSELFHAMGRAMPCCQHASGPFSLGASVPLFASEGKMLAVVAVPVEQSISGLLPNTCLQEICVRGRLTSLLASSTEVVFHNCVGVFG
jgi:hypothetical protein